MPKYLQPMTAQHTWTFRSRLRARAFGWKGSHLACQRLKEAVTEIKRVARTDPVTAGDGVVSLIEKIWPAFQDIDTCRRERCRLPRSRPGIRQHGPHRSAYAQPCIARLPQEGRQVLSGGGSAFNPANSRGVWLRTDRHGPHRCLPSLHGCGTGSRDRFPGTRRSAHRGNETTWTSQRYTHPPVLGGSTGIGVGEDNNHRAADMDKTKPHETLSGTPIAKRVVAKLRRHQRGKVVDIKNVIDGYAMAEGLQKH
jgi:hypothetical protein